MMNVKCACHDEVKCQYHARQPRLCPCGGQLEFYSYREAGVLVPVIETQDGYIIKGRSRVVHHHNARNIWACNRCEHAHVA